MRFDHRNLFGVYPDSSIRIDTAAKYILDVLFVSESTYSALRQLSGQEYWDYLDSLVVYDYNGKDAEQIVQYDCILRGLDV